MWVINSGVYALFCSENYGNWGSAVDVVVGLNKEYLLTVEDILENVLDLIFIVLSEQQQLWFYT